MGLIKAAKGAIGSGFGDQWKEFFYCDALESDVLVTKGSKRITDRSSNTKASDNIISNGSVVAVAHGQCMVICEQGKVVELSAEPGEFIYDSSSEPSIFAGSLGESIIQSFTQAGRRFTFGGDTAKDQRVYYFNTKEIMENKFGTANPIPFRVLDNNIGLDIDVSLRCNGVYSYRIENPMYFFENICGNVEQDFKRDQIDTQLKTEFISALSPALANLSAMGLRPSQIPAHTTELCDFVNTELTQKWLELRGIKVVSIAMNPPTLPDEDAELIKQAQHTAIMRNPSMAAATLVGAQAEAMKSAASNSAGPIHGFMGLGMTQQAGGMNTQALFEMANQQPQQQPQQPAPTQPTPAAVVSTPAAPSADSWKCTCGATVSGKFCTECGAKKPDGGWKCTCGAENTGKFCAECGAKKPDNTTFKCDKCGWVPADPKNPPKFCPECGDVFNDSDKN